MLYQKFNQDLATLVFKQKIDSFEISLFQTVSKSNPRTHSPQQNERTVLMRAAYFKVSTPGGCRDNNHTLLTKKFVFSIKQKKGNATIELCIFELV